LSTRPPSSSPAGRPPAGDAAPSIARRKVRTGERLIINGLFLCAVLSVAVTVGIVAVLLVDTIAFFGDTSLVGFLTGTVWAPGQGAGEGGLYGMLPLLNGTLMIGVGSIVVALPLGLLTAIYLSEYANPRVRGVLKPTLEILAGIPTVIVGFFALQFITPDLLRPIFGDDRVFIFNAAAGSIAVGLMILPIIASISEDAMRAVPSSLREAAFGLGASRRQVSLRVVVQDDLELLRVHPDPDRLHRPDGPWRGGGRHGALRRAVRPRHDPVPADAGHEPHLGPHRPPLPAGVLVTASTEAFAPSRLGRGSTRTAAKILLDTAFSVVLFMGTIVGVVALATLIWTIFDTGWERLVADPVGFLSSYVSRLPARAGIKAALVGSAYLMVLTALFCFPIGVGAAVYLEEFAPRNRVTNFVEANISNLAGVPSVVYGLLGLGIFARFLRMGPSLLAGALTLAVMSLPVIIVAARESIRAVPSGIREGAYALGATKWQTVRRQVLPAAMPGTLTGTILALSRAIGETAPLLVIGLPIVIFSLPNDLRDPVSALPLLIFDWTSRPQPAFAEAAAAASIILLALLLAMNAVAIFLRNRYTIRW
jgi:phosphate transport system permease protein